MTMIEPHASRTEVVATLRRRLKIQFPDLSSSELDSIVAKSVGRTDAGSTRR